MDWLSLPFSLSAINGSPVAWGVAALVVNLGSRFVTMDLTPAQEAVMRHPLTKRLVIFFMIFLVTRNVAIALIITLGVIMVLEGFANEHSPFNIFFTRPIQLPIQQMQQQMQQMAGQREHPHQQ
jgi:hypothetical protein